MAAQFALQPADQAHTYSRFDAHCFWHCLTPKPAVCAGGTWCSYQEPGSNNPGEQQGDADPYGFPPFVDTVQSVLDRLPDEDGRVPVTAAEIAYVGVMVSELCLTYWSFSLAGPCYSPGHVASACASSGYIRLALCHLMPPAPNTAPCVAVVCRFSSS